MLIASIVNLIFETYGWLIIVRVFLTWIPSINWYNQPWASLALISDLLLNPFKRVIPPIGGLDISPIVALIFLRFVQITVVKILVYFGL